MNNVHLWAKHLDRIPSLIGVLSCLSQVTSHTWFSRSFVKGSSWEVAFYHWRDVLSASSGFNRALPLREATGEGDERSELFVRVTREGDLEIPPAQEESAERLRMKTSQVRVTLRSLRVEENLAIDKGTFFIQFYHTILDSMGDDNG